MTLAQQGWLLSISGFIVMVAGIVGLVLGAQLLVEADAVAPEPTKGVTWRSDVMPQGTYSVLPADEAKAFYRWSRPYRITPPTEYDTYPREHK